MDELELLLAELGPTPRATTNISSSSPSTPVRDPPQQSARGKPDPFVHLSAFYSSSPGSPDHNTGRASTTDLDDFLKTLEAEGAGPSSRGTVVVNNGARPAMETSPRQAEVPRAPVPRASVAIPRQQSVYKAGNIPHARKTPMREEFSNLSDDLTSLAGVNSPAETKIYLAEAKCFECNQPIVGQVIKAQGKTFHPEHFSCSNCQNSIGVGAFHEKDAGCLCPKCFQQLLCPRCQQCGDPIVGACVTALGKKWHPGHFACAQCQKPIGNDQFFPRNGLAYCSQHKDGRDGGTICAGCNQSISGEILLAMGKSWHPKHFVCQYCQKSFDGKYFELNGQPYCETHFHQIGNTMCAGCGKSVTGRLIEAFGQKFHPEHFVCAFCMNPLPGGNYTENSGKPYCKTCYSRMFGLNRA